MGLRRVSVFVAVVCLGAAAAAPVSSAEPTSLTLLEVEATGRSERLHRSVRQRASGAPLPDSLRRPDRAAKTGIIAVAAWFGTLFGALRWHTAGADPMASLGYILAALLGTSAVCLVLTRRQRAGVWRLIAMLAVGQAVAFAPVLYRIAS